MKFRYNPAFPNRNVQRVLASLNGEKQLPAVPLLIPDYRGEAMEPSRRGFLGMLAAAFIGLVMPKSRAEVPPADPIIKHREHYDGQRWIADRDSPIRIEFPSQTYLEGDRSVIFHMLQQPECRKMIEAGGYKINDERLFEMLWSVV